MFSVKKSNMSDMKMSDMKNSFRVEQKELHEWLKRERGDQTLTKESVEYLFDKLLVSGYGGLECLKGASDEELLKIGLNDEQITWLKYWIPKNIKKLLEGNWVDGSCMQIFNIVSNENEPIFKVYCGKRLYCKIEYSYNDDRRLVLIIKNYNNDAITKYWDGIILDNFTRIEWTGRNKWGSSEWVKIHN